MTDPTNPEDLLRQALRAHVDSAPLPPVERAVPAIRGRVKRRRALTTATAAIACAAVLAVGFGVARGQGLFDPDPAPPVVTPPTPTGPTDATTAPTSPPTTSDAPTTGDPAAWAGAVVPECGVPLDLPQEPAQVRLDARASGPVPLRGDTWRAVSATNRGGTTLDGRTAHTVSLVLLDADGTVLAFQDLTGTITEAGLAVVHAAPDFTWTSGATSDGFQWCGTEGRGAADDLGGHLPQAGREFTAIALQYVDDPDGAHLTQAQSEPFPITFADVEGVAQFPPAQEGADLAPLCGSELPTQALDTGLTVAVTGDPIRTERAADDGVMGGTLTVRVGRDAVAQDVFGRLMIAQDGVVVGLEVAAGDGGTSFSSSAGGTVEVPLTGIFYSCSEPSTLLPAGAYEVVPALSTTTPDGTLIDLAYADPLTITLH